MKPSFAETELFMADVLSRLWRRDTPDATAAWEALRDLGEDGRAALQEALMETYDHWTEATK